MNSLYFFIKKGNVKIWSTFGQLLVNRKILQFLHKFY